MEKSYVKGILGSFIGGMIASLPWILAYVFGNMIIAILAIFIAMGALKGYQLLNGKVDKKLPIIIAIVSILCVTVSTLIIIPILEIMNIGFEPTLSNLQFVYSNSEFVTALLVDYAISILFTILGISGVIKSIKDDVSNMKDNNTKIEVGNGTKKDFENIKEYFLSRNAINESTAVEIEDGAKLNENSLALLIQNAVVIKKGSKYYFVEANEEKFNKQQKRTRIAVIITVVVLIILAIVSGITSEEDIDTDYRAPKNVTYEISNNYIEEKDEVEEYGWYYIHKDHRFGQNGFISVYYYEETMLLDEQTIKEQKEYWETLDEVKKVTVSKPYKTSNNYDSIEFVLDCGKYTSYLYYVVSDKYLAIIEVNDDNKINGLLEDGKKLVDTFKWIK